jgi:hypothetical protein
VLDDLAALEHVGRVGGDVVGAGAAVDLIDLAVLDVDGVVAGAGNDRVVARAAGQMVVAGTADDGVVADATVLDIVAGVPG